MMAVDLVSLEWDVLGSWRCAFGSAGVASVEGGWA
jgi:hypothetical protein